MPYIRAESLREAMGLNDVDVARMNKVLDKYPMLISDYYFSLIDFKNPRDPILKMAVPSPAEMEGGGSPDTSGEASNTRIPGLQHKYRQTALILSTDKCAMYCRHCFRKRLVGLKSRETAADPEAACAYVAAHEEITNVLISGGDALMNSTAAIERYLKGLAEIPHLDLIRLATRTPVTLPGRITENPGLLALLSKYGQKKRIYVVTQFNHPGELTEKSTAAVRALREAGCSVRNQTVLLKGVNDDAKVLSRLFRGLTRMGCQPYYVFQCRPAAGVKNHFQVPLLTGVKIVEDAKALQNGLGKTFKYCMSHPVGKLEILGSDMEGRMLFKFHGAKDPKNCGRIFSLPLEPGACWLPEKLTHSGGMQ